MALIELLPPKPFPREQKTLRPLRWGSSSVKYAQSTSLPSSSI
ncbi:hypothetical protein [Microcoleus sp. F4-D5]